MGDGQRYRDSEGAEHVFDEQARGPCAFCGGVIQIGVVDSAHEAVIHTSPMCAKFEKLDPLAFLVENRRALGIPDPADEGPN